MFTLPFSLYSTNPEPNYIPHSVRFNPAGNGWLSSGSTTPLLIGTEDFTIEMFVYPLAAPPSNSAATLLNSYSTSPVGGIIVQLRTASGYNGPALGLGNDVVIGSTTSGFALNQWTHYAFTRQGNTLRMFINGVLSGTVTNTTNISVSSGMRMGYLNSTNFLSFNGHMTGVRVSSVALYTANFVVPSISTILPDATTRLLACTYGTLGQDFGRYNAVFSPVGSTVVISTLVPP